MSIFSTSLPWDTPSQIDEKTRTELTRISLALNDRYVQQFVEAHHFCPFAREGRLRGQTRRFIFHADQDTAQDLKRMLDQVADDLQIEVAQVIFPRIEISSKAWVKFCKHFTQEAQRPRREPVLATAALHPALPFAMQSSETLVPLFRRAPDPTIQWVRLSALETVYEGRDHDTAYVDPSQMEAYLEAHPEGRKSLYQRICDRNQQTTTQIGLNKLEAELAEMQAQKEKAYRTLGLFS